MASAVSTRVFSSNSAPLVVRPLVKPNLQTPKKHRGRHS